MKHMPLDQTWKLVELVGERGVNAVLSWEANEENKVSERNARG